VRIPLDIWAPGEREITRCEAARSVGEQETARRQREEASDDEATHHEAALNSE